MVSRLRKRAEKSDIMEIMTRNVVCSRFPLPEGMSDKPLNLTVMNTLGKSNVQVFMSEI